MWSGAPQWASWALQPQHYQNMNHEEVDWAALAKQWIQMKENQDSSSTQPGFPSHPQTDHAAQQPIPPLPPPPPPPPSSQLQPKEHSIPSSDPTEVIVVESDEHTSTTGGEMDMEIEDEKDTSINGERDLSNGDMWGAWNSSSDTSSWAEGGQQGSSWSWGWQVGSNDVKGQSSEIMTGSTQPPFTAKDDGSYSWGVCPPGVMQRVLDYGHKDIRQRKNRESYSDSLPAEEKEPDFQLDAAQRKRLPAWIREGLEKMEREKQRKIEKERLMNDKEAMLQRKKEAEAHARKILEEDLLNEGQPRIPRKSKFESDSEGSGKSRSSSPPETKLGSFTRRRSRFENPSSIDEPEEPLPTSTKPIKQTAAAFTPKVKSEEEKMAEMTIKLRRWMTEILLDVTTKMMREVASEVINKARMKAPTVQVKKSSSALASLSGSLGLSMYGDSDTEEEGSPRPLQVQDIDSDEELRRTIQKKRRDFEIIERGILLKLQEEEEAERRSQKEDQSDSQSIKYEDSEPVTESNEEKRLSPSQSESFQIENSPLDNPSEESNSEEKVEIKDTSSSNSSEEYKKDKDDVDSKVPSTKESSPKSSSSSDRDISASSEEFRKKHKKKRERYFYSRSRSRDRHSRKKKKKRKESRSRSRTRDSSPRRRRSDNGRQRRDKSKERHRRRSLSRDRRRKRSISSDLDRKSSEDSSRRFYRKGKRNIHDDSDNESYKFSRHSRSRSLSNDSGRKRRRRRGYDSSKSSISPSNRYSKKRRSRSRSGSYISRRRKSSKRKRRESRSRKSRYSRSRSRRSRS